MKCVEKRNEAGLHVARGTPRGTRDSALKPARVPHTPSFSYCIWRPATAMFDQLPPELIECITHRLSGDNEVLAAAGACRSLRNSIDAQAIARTSVRRKFWNVVDNMHFTDLYHAVFGESEATALLKVPYPPVRGEPDWDIYIGDEDAVMRLAMGILLGDRTCISMSAPIDMPDMGCEEYHKAAELYVSVFDEWHLDLSGPNRYHGAMSAQVTFRWTNHGPEMQFTTKLGILLLEPGRQAEFLYSFDAFDLDAEWSDDDDAAADDAADAAVITRHVVTTEALYVIARILRFCTAVRDSTFMRRLLTVCDPTFARLVLDA